MSTGKKFGIAMGGLVIAAIAYYFLTVERSRDLVLIGTVDSNQVVVSARIGGRIEKLPVDEGTQVRAGDLIAQLDTAELEAQLRAFEAGTASMRSQVSASQSREELASGETSSAVRAAQAQLDAARAQLAEARADLERVRLDNERIVALANAGVASEQDRDRSVQALKAAQARVASLEDQVRAAQAEVNAAQARTHEAHAAASTVYATRAQAEQAAAQALETRTRLGYTRVTAPLDGTVSVRVAREGEVVAAGQPIVTIVDLNDTWVRAGLPETQATRIAIGDTLKVRLPSGETIEGRVIFKSAESDFATQRDVSRSKRDIRTVVLKVRVDNSRKTLVPGMTAEVLVPTDKLPGHTMARQ